ncbi:hypothetical protein M2282_002963 [Variovorax boronicumulans]|uniref:hypothetical protein n=1 Tax=Variovorax boronicumulans TaxID=436515 RepID=UPI00247314C4|nr:hypothetical protein [Variovorax boronicumulans]MDH6167813.1 hypothetical protein [Variovorax boronicumulans]
MMMFPRGCVCALTISVLLSGCGGGGGGNQGSGLAGLFGLGGGTSGTTGTTTGTTGSQGAGQSGGGTAGTGATDGGTAPVAATTSLVTGLGKPARVLLGLASGAIDQMKSQDIHPDIMDTYLVGVEGYTPGHSWIAWNSPDGAFLTYTAQAVQAYGAIPMFTLYQMTARGEADLSGINDTAFMNKYWAQVRLMYQLIADQRGPVLVNLEPDFWGFLASQAPDRDATRVPAVVSNQPECAGLPNTAAGLGQCMVQMGRQIAPKALVGFPPSFWSGTSAEIGAQMRAVGADKADFIVAQTSDRDAGCWEAKPHPDECAKPTDYWDASNKTSPNFHDSQKQISDYRAALGNSLPILWWQTPMGVPSDTPGGTDLHYRDNRVDYMLRNAQEYGDMHTFAIVFSPGGTYQTSLATDGGQFARLSGQYLSRGGAALK